MKKKNPVPLIVGVVFIVVFTGFLAWRLTVLSTQPRALKDLYLEVTPPDSIALAPDGRLLAYIAPHGDESLLHLRRLDNGAVTLVEGTEAAESPFFSPDGQRVGFYVGGAVRERELESGDEPADASSALAGGAWILAERDDAIVASSLEARADKVLARGARRARYVAPGYLLFLRAGALWATRFDPSEAELLSESFLAVEDVDGWYDVSASGTLVFRRPGGGARRRFAVVLHWKGELERLAAGRHLPAPGRR
jgi:hypothetical protein